MNLAKQKTTNTPLDEDDIELCGRIKERLESCSGGMWFRNGVLKQSLRLLAQKIGVDGPAPALPQQARVNERQVA